MYDYIKGTLEEINPTEAIIENNGIGYNLQISLQTFTAIQSTKEVKLFIYHHVREDIQMWYGFYSKEELAIFTSLIDVSGIGPNTARVMLSSLSCSEIKGAIVSGDVNKIKSVKGIGLKTAQKVIIELKDKFSKSPDDFTELLLGSQPSVNLDEALSALVMLGFNKTAADKVIKSIYKENPNYTIEELIKFSLKRL